MRHGCLTSRRSPQRDCRPGCRAATRTNRSSAHSRFHRNTPNATPSDVDEPQQAVSGWLTDVSERRRLVADPDERLRFETVLSDLSARFINLPADQVDSEIEAALRRLVEILGLDRSTLFQLAEDEKTLVVTHGWAIPGFEPMKELIVRDELPWGLRKVLRGETIVFSSVEDLPEEAARDKVAMRRLGPKSNVSFPLSAGGARCLGRWHSGR